MCSQISFCSDSMSYPLSPGPSCPLSSDHVNYPVFYLSRPSHPVSCPTWTILFSNMCLRRQSCPLSPLTALSSVPLDCPILRHVSTLIILSSVPPDRPILCPLLCPRSRRVLRGLPSDSSGCSRGQEPSRSQHPAAAVEHGGDQRHRGASVLGLELPAAVPGSVQPGGCQC